MTPVTERSRVPGVCPFLGLPDDPPSRFSFPSVGHRCWADGRPHPVDLVQQGTFCLAVTFPECPRYRRSAASRRPDATAPEAPGVALQRVTADAGAAGAPGAAGGSPARDEPGPRAPGRTSRGRRVVAIVLAVAVIAGAAYLAGPAIADWMRQVGAGAGAASPSPSAPLAATPAPSPASTPASTRASTPAPSPAATPLVHVVARGETLIAIAARYGVTVAAIREANGITDPNLIRVGQRLVIPRR